MQSKSSYLAGNEWELCVFLRRRDADRPNTWLCQVISILATYDTRDEWNAKFWQLFAMPLAEFKQYVAGERGIAVHTSFPFTPKVSFKERYGPYPLPKISRIAKHWHGRKQLPPPDVAKAIAEYQQDQILFDEQHNAAWKELVQRRLPTPPTPYYWYHYVGGLMSSDVYFFRLWHPDLGYMPRPE